MLISCGGADLLQSDLEFVLRLQEFIELCRKRDPAAAIAYARKNLAPWASTHMTEVQQGMTLLAFGETTGVQLYRKLYDRSRWVTVRDRFRETFFNIYALPSQSLLALSLSAGLSSLRLPACSGSTAASAAKEDSRTAAYGTSHSHGVPAPLLPQVPDLHAVLGLDSLVVPDIPRAEVKPDSPAPPSEPPSANVDCPTCAPDLRILAREVPMAHHVNSTLVCHISGAVMDSNNEPMAFPNGYVYSSKVSEGRRQRSMRLTCSTGAQGDGKEQLRRRHLPAHERVVYVLAAPEGVYILSVRVLPCTVRCNRTRMNVGRM
jgi:macrophage erythroblast attacher